MAASQWKRSVRVTQVGDYSTPSVNTPRRIAHHPTRAVSPFISLCQSPIVNEHSVVVANCDHTSVWVHIVHSCIIIAMQWVALRKSLLTFLLPAHTLQFSLHSVYKSFQVARSMWLLTIHPSLLLSVVILRLAISEMPCAQPTVVHTLKTYKATAAGAFLSCTNCKMGSKLPEFSGIGVSTRANQYLMKAPFSFRRLVLNSHCSCHRRRPVNVL
jgi:hypothetical protein